MMHRSVTNMFICIGVLSLFIGACNSTDKGTAKLVASQSQAIARGAAWGTVNQLSDDSVGMVIQKARLVDGTEGVNVCMQWLRSTDGGQTWLDPVLMGERRGSDGKLFERQEDGGYIIFQERNQAVGQLPSGRIVAAWVQLNYHYGPDGKERNAPGMDWINPCQGMVVTWSDDMGQTWSTMRPMDVGPFLGPFLGRQNGVSPHWRILSLQDGTALMSLYGNYNPEYKGKLMIPEGTQSMSAVIRSTDEGVTWGDLSLIMHKSGRLMYEETTLVQLDENRLLAHVRTPRHDTDQYQSADAGRTWTGPQTVTQPQQHPAGAIRLQSGNLLLTWGNRRAPYGAMVMLSRDEGKTWDYDHRVSIGWKGFGESCGYANGVQLADGTIKVTYYVMPETKDYHQLWNQSIVYLVSFSEKQFSKAAGYSKMQ